MINCGGFADWSRRVSQKCFPCKLRSGDAALVQKHPKIFARFSELVFLHTFVLLGTNHATKSIVCKVDIFVPVLFVKLRLCEQGGCAPV